MTASKRFFPVLVFAFALPAAPIPGVVVAGTLAAASPAATAPEVPAPRPFIRKLHVRVWDVGAVAPNVSVHVPTCLVTALIRTASITGLLDRALDQVKVNAAEAGDASAAGFHLRGRQIDALWSTLVGSGPASLVEVDDGHGVRVEIRVD